MWRIRSFTDSLRESPGGWVLFALLCWSVHSCSDRDDRLSDLCGLTEEVEGISIPLPPDYAPLLKTVEVPDGSPASIVRELYRWQQLDGWQVDKACRRV
jgi:hypothetical protein